MENDNRSELLKKIDAYIKGKLNEEEINELWVAFAKDPSLLDHLELEVGVRELLKENSGLSVSARKTSIKKLPNYAWYASAAAIVLIVALIQLFNVKPPMSLDDFTIRSIPSEQFEFADATRSDTYNLTEADSLLNMGFEAAYSGNTTEALKLYEQVLNNYNFEPYASKAHLNFGIIYFNRENFDLAIIAFNDAAESAGDNRMILEKAYWFLANAYVAVGEPEKALEAVSTAYSKNGTFREQSFRLYRKLSYDLGKVDYEDFDRQNTENK